MMLSQTSPTRALVCSIMQERPSLSVRPVPLGCCSPCPSDLINGVRKDPRPQKPVTTASFGTTISMTLTETPSPTVVTKTLSSPTMVTGKKATNFAIQNASSVLAVLAAQPSGACVIHSSTPQTKNVESLDKAKLSDLTITVVPKAASEDQVVSSKDGKDSDDEKDRGFDSDDGSNGVGSSGTVRNSRDSKANVKRPSTSTTKRPRKPSLRLRPRKK